MPFFKTAKIPLVSLAEGSYSTSDGSLAFKRIAGKQASAYETAASKINVGDMIKLVAGDYDVSDDPADYIFEAARAVTAEVPNENGDAFPRSELLRFDHRLGKAIYQTFILKPHHINHRADNPKTARGLVIDASYNDLSAPLDKCPGCSAKTASVEARDASGLNCIKCGHVVKDEFVELLIAIDTKKDPTFAEGVRKGSLDSLSMGCEAGYTDCSICANRARSVSQFCSHIKSGNKKKIFKTASGPKMSFEKCGEVVFTEISRVDQPADPTARQKEVFSVNMVPGSDMRMLAARVAQLESKLAHGAKLAQIDESELETILPKIEELKETHPELYMELKKLLSTSDDVSEPTTIDDYAKKRDDDSDKHITPAEMGIEPEAGGLPATIANRIASNINKELEALLAASTDSKENAMTTASLKFATSYKDVEALVTDKGNIQVFTPRGTLFVVRPQVKPSDTVAAQKIATEILTSVAEDGLVATVSKYDAIMGPKVASILQHHIEDFADGREDGDKGPITDVNSKLKSPADALREKPAKNLQEHAERDHTENIGKPGKEVSKDGERDHEVKSKPADKVVEAVEGSVADAEREKTPKTTQDDVTVNFADKQPKKAQLVPSMPPAGVPQAAPAMPQMAVGEMCAAHGAPDCMDCKQAQSFNDDDLQEIADAGATAKPKQGEIDPEVREAARKYVSRAERIYKARIEKAQKVALEKVASAEKTAAEKIQARMLRAFKLAAQRQALNLEASPLKARMFDVLASEMDLDADSFYPGMDPGTAAHLIEAAVSTVMDEFVETLIKRASEFLSMNDEAFGAIEADVKNLKPAPIAVTAEAHKPAARMDVRKAALDGNLVVAPTRNEGVPNRDGRDNIRSALGTTKVRRASQALTK